MSEVHLYLPGARVPALRDAGVRLLPPCAPLHPPFLHLRHGILLLLRIPLGIVPLIFFILGIFPLF